ncbi:CDP-alcohol phosphatidyltransferase-domain-containing protein [Globomyces pollinis-pini]|nr:CDP-alcohol phosphatidyltransferase-domain-containing protein [Globomyces pollinis-pini]
MIIVPHNRVLNSLTRQIRIRSIWLNSRSPSYNQPAFSNLILNNLSLVSKSQWIRSFNIKQPKENIYNIPNALTVSRIMLSPVIGFFIAQQQVTIGLGLLVFAGFTDALDGFIARRFNMKTAVGSVLDPLADKILMTTLAVSLSYANLLPITLCMLIISRDIALVFLSLYRRYTTMTPPKTWGRFWDPSLLNVEIDPPLISKINTFLQLTLMALTLTGSVYDFLSNPLFIALQGSVYVTTIWSGLHYFISNRTMKFLIK